MYKLFKLHFNTAVHFGTGTLGDSSFTLCADTLFSALCNEAAMAYGSKGAKRLLGCVKSGALRITDTMPYMGDTYYIPKPQCGPKRRKTGDSNWEKAYKKARYIPVGGLSEFIEGNLDAAEINKKFNVGSFQSRTNVVINLPEDSKPYEIGVFRFAKGCGLYFFAELASEKEEALLTELLRSISYEGLGGRLSSGLGKFSFDVTDPTSDVMSLLERKGGLNMSLSVCMARESELDAAVESASYTITKRSGFVKSGTTTEAPVKKRDFYAFAAGSCFEHRFEGDVFPVSNKNSHSVYRYALPFFIGV